MEEFEPCSDAWNRDLKSSRQVRGLESGLEELESISRLGIGNAGVRFKLKRLGSGMEEFEKMFEVWNRKKRNSC